jgi:hypothetical protein
MRNFPFDWQLALPVFQRGDCVMQSSVRYVHKFARVAVIAILSWVPLASIYRRPLGLFR